jgi:hypothetical protein
MGNRIQSVMNILGHCYCGAVKYAAEGPTLYQANCHCENCRRAIGAQAVAWITVREPSFQFTAGQPTFFLTPTGATRTFCPTCGTSLTYQHPDRSGEIDLITATLDHPEHFPPNRSVYADEKLPWVQCDAVHVPPPCER